MDLGGDRNEAIDGVEADSLSQKSSYNGPSFKESESDLLLETIEHSGEPRCGFPIRNERRIGFFVETAHE